MLAHFSASSRALLHCKVAAGFSCRVPSVQMPHVGVMMVMVTWWSLILTSLKLTQLTQFTACIVLACPRMILWWSRMLVSDPSGKTVTVGPLGYFWWAFWHSSCHLMSFVIDLRWLLCTDFTKFIVYSNIDPGWFWAMTSQLGYRICSSRYRQNRNLQHQLQDFVLARSVGDGWWFQKCFSTWEDDLNG